MEKLKNLYAGPTDRNHSVGIAQESAGAGWKRVQREKNWDNWNNIFKKI